MRIFNGLLGFALMAVSGVALAAEPVELDSRSMDQVTAGLYNVGAIAFAGPTLAIGASTTTRSIAQFQTFESISLTPPATAVDAGAIAIVQSQVLSSSVGAASASSSGGVLTFITPSVSN